MGLDVRKQVLNGTATIINLTVENQEERQKKEIFNRIDEAIANFDKAIEKGKDHFNVMFSGGKDSTTIIILLLEALKQNKLKKLPTKIDIFYADTQVEIPTMSSRAINFLQVIQAKIDNKIYPIPISIHKTAPKPEETFWTLILGRGYPAPHQRFRWCTSRLKIRPTKIIMENYDKKRSVIITGVRFGESANRDQVLERACSRGGECGQGIWYTESTNENMGFLAPIAWWRACNVWDFLILIAPDWNWPTNGLLELYIEEETRFGCWTCTVIRKDKTMGLITKTEDGKRYKPLLDYRNLLYTLSNSALHPENRVIRKNGIAGRLTLGFRKFLLKKLLETQKMTKLPLISAGEIEEIKRSWTQTLKTNKNKLKYGDSY